MSILKKLATSLGRRDEVPNQVLAKEIAAKGNKKAVEELVENLTNKDKNIQSDCIKALYEIGYLKPELISPYTKEFLNLLDSKNNRMQWGAMTALSGIAKVNPKSVYPSVTKIISVADHGTVITKDHCVKILAALCSVKPYSEKAFPLLIEQMMKAPANQFPSYAEEAMPFVNDKNKLIFVKTITSRFGEFGQESKRKRLEKVLKKVTTEAQRT